MLQAPLFECLSLDPFSSMDDGCCSAEVGVGGRHIVEALVVALVVTMLEERLDLLFEVAGQELGGTAACETRPFQKRAEVNSN